MIDNGLQVRKLLKHHLIRFTCRSVWKWKWKCTFSSHVDFYGEKSPAIVVKVPAAILNPDKLSLNLERK